MGTEPIDGYMFLEADTKDADKTGMAAFVIAMNILRSLRSRGVIDAEEFNKIVENAVAVAGPTEDSGVRRHLYGNLTQESRDRQDRHLRGENP